MKGPRLRAMDICKARKRREEASPADVASREQSQDLNP